MGLNTRSFLLIIVYKVVVELLHPYGLLVSDTNYSQSIDHLKFPLG